MGRNYTNEERIPPTMPINWADWKSDKHVKKMTDTQGYIFFKLLMEQWQFHTVPADPWLLSKQIDSRYENVKTFLRNYGHLFRCAECDGIAWSEAWGQDKPVVALYPDCSCSVVALYCPCSCSVVGLYCDCSCSVVALYNQKLANYRQDVTSKKPLGTTLPDLYRTEPEPELTTTTELSSSSQTESQIGQLEPSAPCQSQTKISAVPKRPRNINDKPANWADLSFSEKESWYVRWGFRPAPNADSKPTQVPAPATTSVLADIREWNEDRFNISGERLRNCILFQLDAAKNTWYRDNEITVASMNREKFVRKLDADTPPGWSPDKPKAGPAANQPETEQQKRLREEREYRARLRAMKEQEEGQA